MITNPTKHVTARDYLYAAIANNELSLDTCAHLDRANNVDASSPGCLECTQAGEEWVNLRICLTCGHVGCCDDSPNQHASKHYHATRHPLIQSFNPGQTWIYCYPDDVILIS
jgi:uncharacterized UBP type Zn finger protein